eukprot:744177-Hanusia_phi.AAC.2
MPLWKRFTTELVPEWQVQCIEYKRLKRLAESLVGREDSREKQESDISAFRDTFAVELEKVSFLYVKHERKLCRFFCSLETKCEAVLQKLQNELEQNSTVGFTRTMQVLQNPAYKQILVALAAFLMHIDALRSFSLLNTLAVVKIAQQHCSKHVGDDVLCRLHEEPFFHCYRLTSLVEEVSALQRKILGNFFGHYDMHTDERQRNPMLDVPATDEVEPSDLSVYCTWKNQRGHLPVWIFKSLAPSSLGDRDIRKIQIVSLLSVFSLQVKGSLRVYGLEQYASMILPRVPSTGDAGSSSTCRQGEQETPVGPAPVRSETQVTNGNCCGANAPMRLPLRRKPLATKEEVDQSVNTNNDLRLQRSCNNLLVLELKEWKWMDNLAAGHYTSAEARSKASTPTSESDRSESECGTCWDPTSLMTEINSLDSCTCKPQSFRRGAQGLECDGALSRMKLRFDITA